VPRSHQVIDLRRPGPTRHDELRERLEAWRVSTARRSSAQPAAILSDLMLARVVEAEPPDLEALAELGIGPSHRRLYGAEICAMVEVVLNDQAAAT